MNQRSAVVEGGHTDRLQSKRKRKRSCQDSLVLEHGGIKYPRIIRGNWIESDHCNEEPTREIISSLSHFQRFECRITTWSTILAVFDGMGSNVITVSDQQRGTIHRCA